MKDIKAKNVVKILKIMWEQYQCKFGLEKLVEKWRIWLENSFTNKVGSKVENR